MTAVEIPLLDLQALRSAALATMRASANDLEAFAAAAKVETELAFQIRRLKRSDASVKAVSHA